MTGPVIALSGPPGAGKSTFGGWLAARFGAGHVDYDDYEQITRKPPAEIAEWLAKGAPIDAIPAPGLPEAVAVARAKGMVVFETPLGRAWPGTEGLIDLSIWIDTPLDLALSRKLQIMAQTAPDAGFRDWLDGYLAAYAGVIRPSLLVQADRVQGLCDLVVPNLTDAGATQNQLAKAVTTFLHRFQSV